MLSGGADAGESVLELADCVFGFGVLRGGGWDGAEGGAVLVWQGAPVQDGGEGGGGGAEEPGQASVDMGEGGGGPSGSRPVNRCEGGTDVMSVPPFFVTTMRRRSGLFRQGGYPSQVMVRTDRRRRGRLTQ